DALQPVRPVRLGDLWKTVEEFLRGLHHAQDSDEGAFDFLAAGTDAHSALGIPAPVAWVLLFAALDEACCQLLAASRAHHKALQRELGIDFLVDNRGRGFSR